MNETQYDRDLTLGQHLEVARLQAGLSLRQLANLSGVHVSVVNRLIKDRIEHPLPDHLVALARALELNEADLFLLAGLPIPKEAASLDIMLRKGYGVSDDEVPELKRQIEALIAQHHQEPKQRKTKGGKSHDKDS
jgi:transcriptional regulator with XRE-family HTH domain